MSHSGSLFTRHSYAIVNQDFENMYMYVVLLLATVNGNIFYNLLDL